MAKIHQWTVDKNAVVEETAEEDTGSGAESGIVSKWGADNRP